MSLASNVQEKAGMIWDIADILTGSYKPHEYGNVILPMAVIARFDSVLKPTKEAVLKADAAIADNPMKDAMLRRESTNDFYNTSQFTLGSLLDDPDNIESNFRNYLNGFSPNVRKIIEKFKFDSEISLMTEKKLLYSVIKEFTDPKAELSPVKVSNLEMGYIFEEIIRKFSEASNESSGEHFTPREIVALGADLLTAEDSEVLSKPNVVRTVCDAACGTGGMLSETTRRIHEMNKSATVVPFGNEINDTTFAICRADMLIKGEDSENIHNRNTLTDNPFKEDKFDYIIMNPPFGRKWDTFKDTIKKEADLGYEGRFGPGLPSTSDSQMLFLLTAVSYMKKPSDGGSRIAIIHNGSPLFTGDAGSGPSNIRQYLLENDLLEAVIALPDQIFYNTSIGTYFWVLSNKKKGTRREGKVQLIDARNLYTKMRKSLGNKRNELSEEQVAQIVKEYSDFKETEISKIFDNDDFGYTKVEVVQQKLDKNGNPVTEGRNKKPVLVPGFKDTEKISLKENIEDYLDREVRPFVPGAVADLKKSKIGYEIPFSRYFYKYKKSRSTNEIEASIQSLMKTVQVDLEGLFGGAADE